MIAVSLGVALFVRAVEPCANAAAQVAPVANRGEQEPAAAKGEVVSELDNAIWHVFQASNEVCWFGSHDRGVYRYDGKTLLRFTTKDGLQSNSIGGFQEDKAGNVYITNDGISRHDGRAFTTVSIATNADTSDWKLRSDDLWFTAPSNAGVVYRFDGEVLHPLAFPRTEDGDRDYEAVPRSKYPNAKYSPYDVFTIFRDGRGSLWFGTAVLGACRYDGKSFAWIPERELGNGSFGTRSIIEDKDGWIWFCDPRHRYQVAASDPAGPSYRKEDGLRDNEKPARAPFSGVISAARDRDGALWMATYGEGVWRTDGVNATHYPVTVDGQAITLFSIYLDRHGVLWLGTQVAGAWRFNGKSFERFNPSRSEVRPADARE